MKCRKDQFKCKNGDCIPKEYECDGEEIWGHDCDDGSDEHYRCPKQEGESCGRSTRWPSKILSCGQFIQPSKSLASERTSIMRIYGDCDLGKNLCCYNPQRRGEGICKKIVPISGNE